MDSSDRTAWSRFLRDVFAETHRVADRAVREFAPGGRVPTRAGGTGTTQGAQPPSADLTAIAGLTPADDDLLQRKAGAWTNRTLAQLIADLIAVGAWTEAVQDVIGAMVAAAGGTYDDAAGTITLPGGGGGGGGHVIEAPDGTDLAARGHLQFLGVVPTDDSGNDRTIVDLSTLPGSEPLAAPPATAHAKDDEFAAGSLDGKWTDPAVTGRTNTIGVAGGWLTIEPSETGAGNTGSRGSNGIRQVAPTGSFTVTARVADNAPANDDGRLGLFTGRTASAKGHIWGPYRAAGFAAGYCTFGYSETTPWLYDSDTNTNFGGTYVRANYYRIRWDATASTLTFSYSLDGVFWTAAVTRTSQAQPDRIGLVLWSNSGTLLADHALACDFFRVTEP